MDLELGLKDGSGKEFGKWEMKTVLGIGTMEAKNQKRFRRKLAHWIRAWGFHIQAELLSNTSVAVQICDIEQVTYRILIPSIVEWEWLIVIVSVVVRLK